MGQDDESAAVSPLTPGHRPLYTVSLPISIGRLIVAH
jgi:hypothetical protein